MNPGSRWLAFRTPTSTSSRSASAGTCSAGRPTRATPSRCSTPTSRRAATSSTRPTSTRPGSPGNSGGESETIIGEWMAARGNRERDRGRDQGRHARGRTGLAADNVRAATEDSLRRLQTDYIDLYYAHQRRPGHAARGDARRVRRARAARARLRYSAASNYTAPRLARGARRSATREGLPRYVALQTALQPDGTRRYEDGLAEVCAPRGPRLPPLLAPRQGLPHRQVPPEGRSVDSPRAGAARRLPGRPRAAPCSRRSTRSPPRTAPPSPPSRWPGCAAQPTVVAPVASARTPEQLAELLPFVELELSADELTRLSDAAGV